MSRGKIRVGVGGWSFAPWRGVFYPPELRQKDELSYAVSQMTAIEINATYYSTQSPKSFANWAAAAPDGFEYSAKASRFCTNRKILADAGPSIEKYLGQGLSELGDKLGPIVWQFAATKKFDPQDFGAFLELLPENLAGRRLRHALDVRNVSFDNPSFIELARTKGMAIVHNDHPEYPLIKADTADFVYARVMQAQEGLEEGYSRTDLDKWADNARTWAADGRDVYLFFISGAKVRNPAAARAVIDRLA
ncbi:MAG: DUF72 domain-containing protein [Sphingomonadaceae bacterium]|nr:DUF72 domain-containing protein [Sphingomonadaceae bacterium]